MSLTSAKMSNLRDKLEALTEAEVKEEIKEVVEKTHKVEKVKKIKK